MKNNTVAFSGHRLSKLSNNSLVSKNTNHNIKRLLRESIIDHINRGFNIFLSGMADGIDTFAAQIIIDLKGQYSGLKLHAIIPFEGHINDFTGNHYDEYKKIIENSDEVTCLSAKKVRGVYHARNRYLVDNSQSLICYYNGQSGVTEYTVEYAQKQNKPVVNIAKHEEPIKYIDNMTYSLKQDLKFNIDKHSRLSVAASCFSIYAYQEVKKELQNIDEFRFIFTSPAFTTEQANKEKREFFIPQRAREKSLYGTEFEVKLRNELTQKAIAKECAEWIKNKATFKTNISRDNMNGFINIEDKNNSVAYAPVNGFTTTDLGCERGNSMYSLITRQSYPISQNFINIFNSVWNDKSKLQDVTDIVIDNITVAYKENSPEFLYFITLYNVFNEFLEDISEDVLPNEATGFKKSLIWNKLYNFQQDAVLAIINKLEKYNGCILADSVGLGKTYTALATIKYYESRNKSVLVLCPKKLSDNWNTFKQNLLNNPIAKDRLNYDVLYHTDLSRTSGYSNGIPLDRINWGNYDLVVIDESHNFRNGGDVFNETRTKENRYVRLMNNVIRAGVKTKVLMLSATPVNNRFSDLKNQIALAYEGETDKINSQLNIDRDIEDIFNNAQRHFNAWNKLSPEDRTTEKLLSMLDFDFFEVLDSVTIARSRSHIEKYYDTKDIGKFPERLKPISKMCRLTDLYDAVTYNDIYTELSKLNLSIYTPSTYILPSKASKYEELYDTKVGRSSFKQVDREKSLLVLMRINLLKRLESSVHSFRLTINRMIELLSDTVTLINDYENGKRININDFVEDYDLDIDDENTDIFSVGKSVQIELGDMDYTSWKFELEQDLLILSSLLKEMEKITPEHDNKLTVLYDCIKEKIQKPINEGNKKVIIFSAFSDTVDYLYNSLEKKVKAEFGVDTAMITGSVDGKTTIKGLKTDLNTVLTCFSPKSKEKHLIMPNDNHEIDLLIATDCISEGQNLQDCDCLINYDIHWNPVRIIQRFGRIDRIGSINTRIQLINFWPDISLDEYINLKSRVETRMKISIMTSTGDDNPIDKNDGDLEYRKKQLERLQKEVVDIEDMSEGISIMDLGLNEFRLDLLAYIKNNSNVDKAPNGMHTIINSDGSYPNGVIYVDNSTDNEFDPCDLCAKEHS